MLLINVDSHAAAYQFTGSIGKFVRAVLCKLQLHLIFFNSGLVRILYGPAGGDVPSLQHYSAALIPEGQIGHVAQFRDGSLRLKILFVGFPRKTDDRSL